MVQQQQRMNLWYWHTKAMCQADIVITVNAIEMLQTFDIIQVYILLRCNKLVERKHEFSGGVYERRSWCDYQSGR